MNKLSGQFISAIHDYQYLMERHYAEKSTLKLVSDRYALSGEERSVLFRGVITKEVVKKRKNKLIARPESGSSFIIDGYNVIRTVGSYLTGNLVFVAMDGFIRDVSEIHKKSVKDDIVLKAVDLILVTLKSLKPINVLFYLDMPVSKSGELADYISRSLSSQELTGNAETVHSPDHHLKKAEMGIVCTSDSVIIDECHLSVFDLARRTLDLHFSTEFICLTDST